MKNGHINKIDEQPKKQENKERKKTAETYDSIIEGFTQDEGLREALRDFLQYKVASCHRAKKEFTNRALKVNLTKLSKLTSDPREMVEIINQTLERSWSGFFPLKSDYSQKRQPAQQKLEISEPRIGSMRIDNMTGRQEVYRGNGVWEEYVSDYVPQEGDEDIDL